MKRGFTLIEIMVATTIFSIVMVASMGALLSIVGVNRTSQSLQSVMNNLNFALESMSREIRVGSKYDCSSCLSGTFSFQSKDGVSSIFYRQSEGKIQRSTDEGVTFTDITAPEIEILNMTFNVAGETSGDGQQPRVLLIVQGRAGKVGKGDASFNLQTTISQRQLDL